MQRLEEDPQQFVEETSHDILSQRVASLLETHQTSEELNEMGIETASKAKLDVLFVDAGGDPESPANIRLVNLKNVYTGRTSRNVFQETCAPEALCAGIYIPDMDEIQKQCINEHPELQKDIVALKEMAKKTAYLTAEYIRRSLVKSVHTREKDPPFSIAVASEEQLAQWEQQGFTSDLPPFRKGAVRPKDVLQQLFYDIDGNRNGSLVQAGIDYKTRGVMIPGLDISLVKKDSNGMSTPAKVDLYGYGKGDELIPYANVVGLVCTESGLSVGERKRIARRMTNQVRYWLNDPTVQVMNVDPELLTLWKECGAVVKQNETQFVDMTLQRTQSGYGFLGGGLIQSVSVNMIENRQQIGGNKVIPTVRTSDGTVSALFDFGWSYPDEQVVSGFPNRPPYQKGLTPYLESKILPPIRRLYRTDLLETSLDAGTLVNAAGGSYSYIASELYHRLGKKDFIDAVRRRVPNFRDFDTLLSRLGSYEEQYYRDKTTYAAILLSHAHVDHSGAMFAVRDEIPAGMTPASAALLHAGYRSGWHYTTQEPIIRKMRELGKVGSSYETAERPLFLFGNSQSMFISPEMRVTAHHVNHSIPGATAYVLEVMENGQPLVGIGYTGDWRSGSLTDGAIHALGDCDTVVVEGTNFGSDKPSTGITEARVAETLEAYRQQEDQRGGLYVIQLDGKNTERLENVVSGSKGRKVVVPLGTAQILHEIAMMNEALPRGQQISAPVLGTDVIPFEPQKAMYDLWERQLMETYGSVSMNDIVLDPKNFTLVTDPYKSLYSIFGELPKGFVGTVVRSTYWPYGDSDKQLTLSNYHWCIQHGLQYIADIDLSHNSIRKPRDPIGVHASGHMTPDETLDVIATWANRGNVTKIIPLHTTARGRFSDQVKNMLRQQNIAVYPEGAFQIQRGVGKGGYVMPLWDRNGKKSGK
jgi:mRNA degradation ribonuclease J1/J2